MPNSNEPMWQESDSKPNGPTPTPTMSRQIGLLRRVAIVGSSGVLFWRATSLSGMQPRQNWGIVVVLGVAFAAALTCLMLMPAATGRLRRHMDLLLPLSLYIPTEALLSCLAALPVLSAVLSPSWSLKILSLSFSH
ncbi:MAG: hypothetical protein ABSG86_21165 [Thermoguttaceae bacterium]